MIVKKGILFFFFCSYILVAQARIDSLNLQHSKEEQFQNQFYEGLKQKGIENYNEAITAFTRCAELFPERAVVFYELGDLFLKTKSYNRSENYLQKAVKLDPKQFWYKEKLYQLYVNSQDYNKAIQALKPLLHKNRDYEEDLINLYTETGRYEEALVQIEYLDKRYGYNSNRDQTRVEIYKRTKNVKSHLTFLKQRLKIDPNSPKNFLNLIYTLSQYNLKNEAFLTAKQFLSTHPKSHIAHVALYKFYLDDRQYDNAISSMKIVTASNILEPYLKLKVLQDFIQFVKDNPKYEAVLLEIQPAESLDVSNRSNIDWAEFYLQQNKIDKAIEYFEKSIQDSPNNLMAIKTLAQLYFKIKQFNRAASFSEEQLDFHPTQIELYLIYGQSKLALNLPQDAIARLEIGLDFIFEESEISLSYYELMADIYTKLNNINKAKSFTNKVKALKR